MLLRVLFILFCLILCAPSAQAAACLDVFPSGWRENTPANEQLINFPSNFSGATLTDGTTLPRGDNLYNNSNLGNKGEVYVSGLSGSETTARLFFRSSVSWQNVKINENGDPEDLIIVIDGGLQITGGSTVINAIIYVKGTTSVNGNSTINGAVATVGSSDLFNVNYDESFITNADFNGMCNNTPSERTPITEHRFDETLYTGAPGEVIDSIGDFHGQAINSQPVEGKVCNAIDLSTTGTSNYAVLDKDILTGKTDFTISLWSQTSKTSNQSILSGAGNNSSNELIMWFTNHTSFRPFLKGSQNGVITTPSIADDNWQHIVWRREGSQNCLFIDKELQGCVSLTTLPLNIQSLILGQEQDSVGGGFSSSQAFDGLLDELLVFDSAISPDDIAIIYDNQNAGLGYDGSTRDCPIAAFPSPVLDLHFDELNWDADDSIIDISGNDYHANAVNVSPTEGFICNAADLTATGINDYITLDSEAMNNLSNFSISLWYQTPKTGPQSIISGSSISSFNELIFWFTNSTLFSPHIKGGNRSIVTENVSDGVWHHLVWTRSGSRNLFYRDGVLQTGTAILSTGALNITSLILGQEQDSLGGTFDASQAVEGLVDELLIFDKAMTAAQVNTVFDNESAGLNYDGTERSCGRGEPIAEWRMDEQTWNGSAGEVIDDSGNDYHGKAVSASPTEGFICNAADLSATGTNDYLSLDYNAINGLKDFTLSAWVNTDRTSAQTILSVANSTQSNEAVFYYENNTSSWPTLRESPFNTSTKTAVSNISTGTWKHHVWTRKTNVNNGELCLYIDNVLQGCSTHNNGEFAIDVDATGFILGQEQDSLGGDFDSSQAFSGLLDEVLLFDTVLSSNDINSINNNQSQGKNWDGTDRSCGNFIDHFEINTLNAQGLTCEPDIIKLRACSDPSCSIINPDAVDVVLSVSDINDEVLTKNVTIVGGEIDVEYIHTTGEVVSLSLDQKFECLNGSPTECDVTFSDTGFRFITGTDNLNLPVQLSGKPSNIGFNASTLKVEAVRTDPLNPAGACAALLVTGESIAMAASYQSPSVGSAEVNISGKDIGTAINGTAFDSLPFTDVPLDFGNDTQSSAEYIFTYSDAGSVILNASYELPDDEGNPSGDFITGISNPIIVRPFAFDMFIDNNLPTGDSDYKVNPKAQSGLPSNNVFMAAGEDIKISMRAVAWKVGDDDNANGLADEGEVFTNNATTANFTGLNLTSLTPMLVEPSTGVLGDLTVSDSGDFGAGVKVDTATYDEVGIISLEALTENYLGSDENIEGVVPYLGRFTPHHFTVTSQENGALMGSCEAIPNADEPLTGLPFVFSGQMLWDSATSSITTTGALRYFTNLNPEIEIEARNKNEALTKNYVGDFYKLSLTSFARLTVALPVGSTTLAPDTDAERTGVDGKLVKLLANINDASLVNDTGKTTYTYANSDNFVYLHEANSEIDEFPSNIRLSMVSIIDEDTVATDDTDSDPANGILTLSPTGVPIRFGRAQLDNSYGPDTSPLPQTLSVTYFKDGQYKVAEDDYCTPYNSKEVTITNVDLSSTLPETNVVNGKFITEVPPGETRKIILDASGVSNTGQVCVSYSILPWLQYKWATDVDNLQCPFTSTDVDGLYNDNPFGIATFGIYRGNDRIIYQREILR